MWVEQFNYDDRGSWREWPVVGGQFFHNCAVAGALAAAEDRGYKSGYRTGKEHGWTLGFRAAMEKTD